jgi:hypothetical protein
MEESILGQTPTNSVLLIDETLMESGQVEKHGVDNIKAIATLIEQQNIEYDFGFYKTEMPRSVSCIVLGIGRSMFKNTTHVPVKPVS